MAKNRRKNNAPAKEEVKETQEETVETPVEETQEEVVETEAPVEEVVETEAPVEEEKVVEQSRIVKVIDRFISNNLSVPSTTVSDAAFNLIETVRLEAGRDSADQMFKDLVAEFDNQSKLNTSVLGTPDIFWTRDDDSRVAYNALVAFIVAHNSGTSDNFNSSNIISNFRGKYSIIGEKIVQLFL